MFPCSKCSEDFAVYAETCFKAFGDRVKHWITLNEPHTVATMGYDTGLEAPGRCSVLLHLHCRSGDSHTEPYIVGHNFILAHATVADIYRRKYKVSNPFNNTKYISLFQLGTSLLMCWYSFHQFVGDSERTTRDCLKRRVV